MAALAKTLEENQFKEQNVYKVFSDSVHGWAAARADVSIPSYARVLECCR